MELILAWLARITLLACGVVAVREVVRWVRRARVERRELWARRIALGMAILGVAYVLGHAWLLVNREAIEQGRMWYVRWGDPRLAEERRAEVRGWILDCTGRDGAALARYGAVDGEVRRIYPLGDATVNLIGDPEGQRDFTVERLFASRLREPADLSERGRLHPAGRDMRLTLCADLTGLAWDQLRGSGRQGAVVVQEVETGAVLTYAASGGAGDPPLATRRYAPPGSVFKLALAGLWWEHGLPDGPIACPAAIPVGGRTIANYGRRAHPPVDPEGMLVISCNTAAVSMAVEMRTRLGEDAFAEFYRGLGMEIYADTPPGGADADFWTTRSDAWARRMGPSRSRIRIAPTVDAFSWALMGIGQGPVDVTVMQVSRMAQAIGNDGVMRTATLEWDLAGETEGARVMRTETALRLQRAMRGVVERGTATAVRGRLADTGWALGGKTGTAQRAGVADDGWFSGLVFDPSGQARYTVTVYLEGGGPGGAAPARIAAEVAARLAADVPSTRRDDPVVAEET
jgi:cell division protein FtsI/penicillin-binding protein 2